MRFTSSTSSTSSGASVSAYNSDKVRLQDSITKVYQEIHDQNDQKSEYKDIENETYRLYNRQQAIYHMVASIALVSVIVTLHRLA